MGACDHGRYLARYAEGAADLARAQDLRWRAFRAGRGGDAVRGREADRFDAVCRHVLVEARDTGRPVAAFRLLPLPCGRDIGQSYAAQFYELSALSAYPGRMAEVGRFCVDPAVRDPDVLRTAWGAMTRFVEAEGIEMLFGCSSFRGTDVAAYLDTFAVLTARHLAPRRWLPRVKAPNVFRFAARRVARPDARRALKAMPPLLRTYLTMGGWVSDHAVIDEDLGTLHVFTGLEVHRVPASRASALRRLAG